MSGSSDILYSEYVELLNLVGASTSRSYAPQRFDRGKGKFASNLRRQVKLRAVIPTKDEDAFYAGNPILSDDEQSHSTADELEMSNISVPSILKTSKNRPKSADVTSSIAQTTDSELVMRKSVSYLETTPQTDRPQSHESPNTPAEKKRGKLSIRLDRDGVPLFMKESVGKDRFLQRMKERDDEEAVEARRRKRLGSNRKFIENGYILMKEGVPYVYDDHGFLIPKKNYKPHQKVDHGRLKTRHETRFFQGDIIRKTRVQVEAKKKSLVELNTDLVWRPLCLPASSFMPKHLRSRVKTTMFAEKTTSILRQTVSSGKTIPLSFLRKWNEYNQMENLDCIITVEYCCDCGSHDFNTRHDEFLYLDQLRKTLEVLGDTVSHFSLRVAILPKPTSKCGFIVPELKCSNQQTNSSASKDSYEYLMEEYIDYSKRYGAFEVQIGLKNANGEFLAHILHSKLFRGCWPSKKALKTQCRHLFSEAGIRALSTPITREQFNPSSYQAPVEEKGALRGIQYCFDARFDDCVDQIESRSSSPMKHESVVPFGTTQNDIEAQKELSWAVEAEIKVRLAVEKELLDLRERQIAVEDENIRLRAEMDRQKAIQDEASRLKAIQDEASRLKAIQDEGARLKAIQDEEARLKAIQDEEARLKAIQVEGELIERKRVENDKYERMRSRVREQAEQAIELASEMHVFSNVNDLMRGHRLDDAQILLDKFPAKMHFKDENGWTPLHWACFLGYTEGVVMLIERGADLVDDRNVAGETALDLARVNGDAFAREIEALAARLVNTKNQVVYEDDFEEVPRDTLCADDDEFLSLEVDSSKITTKLPSNEITRRMTALKVMMKEDEPSDNDDGIFLDDDDFFNNLEIDNDGDS